MNIPKKDFSIKVGPFEYEVIYSDDVTHENSTFGSTHNTNQKIFLCPQYKQQKIEQTFIHELMHALMFISGLSYRFDSKKIEALPVEEDICRDISILFYQFIEDNPQLFYDKKK